MNKGVLWAIVGVVVVGGIIGLSKLSGPSETADNGSSADALSDTSEAMTDSESMMKKGAMSLEDLAGAGEDVMCTFSTEDANAKSSGTVYVGNGNMRGDFESVITAANISVASHMIQKDGYIYTWSDAAPQGVKIKVTSSQKTGSNMATGKTMEQGFDPRATLNYDCKSWNPDVAKFAVPSTVSFMEAPAY